MTTAVTCPIVRTHPAVIAQAIAQLRMYGEQVLPALRTAEGTSG